MYFKSTPLHNDINYSQVINIFSGTVTSARLISSLGISVGDGGEEKTPMFGVWLALVLPLQQGWLNDPNGDIIEEPSICSFGGGGREKVDIRKRLFRDSLLFANDGSLSDDRLSTCTYDCTP